MNETFIFSTVYPSHLTHLSIPASYSTAEEIFFYRYIGCETAPSYFCMSSMSQKLILEMNLKKQQISIQNVIWQL